MGRTPTVAAAKTGHRDPSDVSGNCALAFPIPGCSARHRCERELRVNEEVIDMPPRGARSSAGHADVSENAGESTGTLG